jgi:RNA polymerase primary sigma factor/RNA polymerase nonessential primary-like sigma factor
MPVLSHDQADSYRDGNATLFEQRRHVLEQLEQHTDDDASDVSTRRKVRMLRRNLDDLTAQIVTYNIGLVRSYTRRFRGMANPDQREEFEAAGMLGLMRAVDSFDPESGAFGQWAFKPIQREVLRAVRDSDHPNLNLGDFEKRPAILKAYRHLQGVDESYQPSEAEVAAAAGVTVAQVRRVLAPPQLESINETVGGETDTELAETIASTAPSTESEVISKQMLAALRTIGLRALDARELYVVVRRFGLDGEPADRLADIGDTLALSREAVRQIESKAIAKLQHPLVLNKLNARSEGRCTRVAS